MKKGTKVSNPVYAFFQTEVEGFDSLAELALDMHWYWNHSADEVWRQLEPELWDLTSHPWVVLQTGSLDRLHRALADPAFRRKVDDLLETINQQVQSPGWFQQNHPQSKLSSSDLRLGEVKVTSGNGRDAFEVQVLLGGLDSNSLRIEIHAEGPKEGGQVAQEMTRGRQLVGAKGFMYSAQVP